jgi:defect-in-organelle-trafficking protein DotD
MNTIKKALIITTCATLLSGCSLMGKKSEPQNTTDDVINKNIELAISTIQKTQAELYQYGAINEKAVGITGGIYHDNVRIDMNWNGDAYELLTQMAKQRSFAFRSAGTKLPLPVSLKVSRAEYKDVMDSIQTQIGYRASIIVDNATRVITLKYNSPDTQEATTARVIRTGPERAVTYSTTAPAPQRNNGTQYSPSGNQTCTTTCTTGSGKGLFSGGNSTVVNADKLGATCSGNGVLSRDIEGKPLSCRDGRWRKL